MMYTQVRTNFSLIYLTSQLKAGLTQGHFLKYLSSCKQMQGIKFSLVNIRFLKEP